MAEEDKEYKEFKKVTIFNIVERCVLIGLLLAFVGVVWYGYPKVVTFENDIKALNDYADTTLRDMRSGDVEIMVNKSTKEAFDTYVQTQGNLLAIVAVLITVIVIVIPLILNNNLHKTNEFWFKKRTNDGLKEMEQKMDAQMQSQLNEGKKTLKDETTQSVRDVESKLNDRLRDIEQQINELKSGAVNEINTAKHGEEAKKVKEKDNADDQIEGFKEMIIKTDGNVPAEVYFDLGKLYRAKDDYHNAENNLEEAIRRMPKYVEAYQELVEVLMSTTDTEAKGKNLKKAWEYLEKAIALADNKYDLIKLRIKLFIAMGMYEAANRVVEDYIKEAREKGITPRISEGEEMQKANLQQQKEKTQIKDVETISIGKTTIKMIKVAGGSFMMGASDEDKEAFPIEKPAHRVLLDDYYIGETVVTQKMWKAVMGNNSSVSEGEDNPVEWVSWNDCQEFIQKLNEKTRRTFRLPTEAEWEFAARGGNKSKGFKYSGSNDINEVAWYWQNRGDKILEGTDDDYKFEQIAKNHSKIHPVGQKKPNELGLYDMSGNVGEWCNDWFAIYSADPQINPEGPKEGGVRVVRGGDRISPAKECRVSLRLGIDPGEKYFFLGFRLALDPETTTEC